MQISIVSRSGPVLDAYKRFFDKHCINLIPVPSIAELCRTLPVTATCGIVIEIHMLVKATEAEKDMLHTMERIFPSIKTNWNPEAGFRALYNDSGKSGEANMLAFVRDCRNFKPRALRKDKRHEKKFNALFWPIDASEASARRAVTLDVSAGGLFVATCDPPPDDSLVWVILREVDARPFKVLVKWALAWGVAMRIPGFGGSFVDADGGLAEKLAASLAEKT
jgi:hypothetical protein